MVSEYRGTAKDILKRAFRDKMKAVSAKYDAQIDRQRARRAPIGGIDAIAMFEAFLVRYPNDKRWTPDAMFRLAELYYERSAEDYLDADEAYKKAIDGPNPTDAPPPKVDYTPTITLYRRLLTDFPNYRFLDATYYLLGFCLGEMGEDQQAKQAACSPSCAPISSSRSTRPRRRPRTAAARGTSMTAASPCARSSKFYGEAWTRIGEFHFDSAAASSSTPSRPSRRC